MILAYFGKWLPLAQVRYDCGVSRDGSSLGNISSAAKNYGLETEALSVDPEDIRDLHLPCIAHWDFQHFVVITGIKGDKLYINDPAVSTNA